MELFPWNVKGFRNVLFSFLNINSLIWYYIIYIFDTNLKYHIRFQTNEIILRLSENECIKHRLAKFSNGQQETYSCDLWPSKAPFNFHAELKQTQPPAMCWNSEFLESLLEITTPFVLSSLSRIVPAEITPWNNIPFSPYTCLFYTLYLQIYIYEKFRIKTLNSIHW